MTAADVATKIQEFRDKAEKAKLKAAATSDRVARRMFEDAALQFDTMADNLEHHGRTY